MVHGQVPRLLKSQQICESDCGGKSDGGWEEMRVSAWGLTARGVVGALPGVWKGGSSGAEDVLARKGERSGQ